MGKRITQLEGMTTVGNTDLLYGVDVDDLTHSPEGTSKKFTKANLLKEVVQGVSDNAGDISDIRTDVTDIYSAIEQGYTGWNPLGQTLTYVSVDDPTGIVKVVGVNVTDKLSVGMRLMFTNGGNIIKGIITSLAFSSDTIITFLHEIDPTDSQALTLMVDSAITLSYFSTQKAPYGFPLNPAKWSVLKTDTSARTQGSAVSNTWYNIGTTNSQLTLPIGAWNVSFKVSMVGVSSSTTVMTIRACLSTANNASTNQNLQGQSYSNSELWLANTFVGSDIISIDSKTTYYLNALCISTSLSTITFDNNATSMFIRATCAYL